ncbi:MAG: hypothetical protein QN168_07110 [Armatimonadota bacterium]|nr:hypothetical protein [Armatimonadota bacterium]
MATCEWAILCDYAFQDIGRKSCLIGIFDRIFAARVPATHHQAAVVIKLVGNPQERVQIRLAISRPTGETLAEVTGTAQLSDAGTLEQGLNLGNLPLPDFGIYAIKIFLGDAPDPAKMITFTVTRPPQPPSSPSLPPQA